MKNVSHTSPLWSLTLLVLCLANRSVATAQIDPTAAIISAAARSVVQIITLDCPGLEPSRAGSGFIWTSADHVVTDLHVVAGCPTIKVFSPSVKYVVGHVERALPDADLVLIKLDKQIPFTPLTVSSSLPKANDVLEAIGYYYGVSTVDNRPLKVTIGSPVLQDMLTDNLAQSIKNAGYSKKFLELDILRLDGNLTPGLSGAPVIDHSGKVVGIGSGGLEQGLSGIAWATQAHYLAELKTAPPLPLNSTGTAFTSVKSTKAFYSASAESGGTSIRCGDLSFVRSKSRTVKDLLPTHDDQIGFLQIASTTGLKLDIINEVALDVYSEPSSGGSFAVPAGTTLAETDGICRAHLANGKVEIQVFSAKRSTPFELNNAFLAFEGQQTVGSPLQWGVDPSFTYPAPHPRSDGFLVFRKAARGVSGYTWRGEALETIMEKGQQAIGIVVINSDYNPPLYQQCLASPQSESCQGVMSDYRLWVAGGLGVHLSSFPQS
ncbi:S1 family peptidase [Tunturiibacter gelidoferens]|uniref:Trypsin-like peptidase domain-containing protein n=1 Tax=Tunturiibacter lichenicola TaxID=2051959 RepID=A0A7Y9NS35_9BACT|nr:serine protease [Edaphobacter lichenicola]NYF53963.1 hypothetical protein [Edaphobacter lichenicola]